MLQRSLPESSASVVAIVGRADERVRGFVLDEQSGFTPREMQAWGSPPWNAAPPRDAGAVFEIALAQMRAFREIRPRATGLLLDIAKIGPLGVARARVPLHASDF